ncbi:MAG: hypothetical protein H6582_06580 [Crocinitomicaceae bacterium]|nr:hypothetical protein [Crocinitomicaceae bacterium]
MITILLLLVIHFVIITKTQPVEMVIDDWWLIHLFMATITLSGFFLISNSEQKSNDIRSVGRSYLLYTSVKVFLAMAFLSPWLIMKEEGTKMFVMHFFAIFFPYLLVETVLLIRYLNAPMVEKTKSDENQS